MAAAADRIPLFTAAPVSHRRPATSRHAYTFRRTRVRSIVRTGGPSVPLQPRQAAHAYARLRPARPSPADIGSASAHGPRYAHRRPLPRRLPDFRIRTGVLLGRGEDVLGAARCVDNRG